MKQNNAGCFTAAVVGMSRFIVLFAWIARPIAFDAAFYGSWIIPCLGVMILPFTTLMYLILITNQVGRSLSGMDWVWIALAVVVDLAGAAAAAAQNRNRVPQGYPGALPPEPPALLLQHLRLNSNYISKSPDLRTLLFKIHIYKEFSGFQPDWQAG